MVTGSDTGVGKTHVVGALARLLARADACVQIVKVVETGRVAGTAGDAQFAAQLARIDVGRGLPTPASSSSHPSHLDKLAVPDPGRVVAGVLDPGPNDVPGSPDSRACSSLRAFTLATFAAPLAPAAAAAAEGRTISFASLLEQLNALPPCDWRIVEGAGGIATPIDAASHDWADFAAAAAVDAIVVVVPDRLGAINQARLASARAAQTGLSSGVWLNATAPVDAAVAQSTREALAAAGVPLWGELGFGAIDATGFDLNTWASLTQTPRRSDEDGVCKTDVLHGRIPTVGEVLSPDSHPILDRCRTALAARDSQNLRRRLRVSTHNDGVLNLADNDYLALATDPVVTAAVVDAARTYGTSASASPLITGWREPHAALVERLAAWHGFSCGLLWSSGYAANAAVLGGLPQRGDLVFADRLIHASMIAGLLRSGARLQRYPHLDLDRLEALLQAATARSAQTKEQRLGTRDQAAEIWDEGQETSDQKPLSRTPNSKHQTAPSSLAPEPRPQSLDPARRAPTPDPKSIFVVTESLFSMDGDYPDLRRMAELKRRYGFCWIVDEAHALGWYGRDGAGLVAAANVAGEVDVLVGTLGKTLGSGGAYTLFRDEALRDYLLNTAGEFIYSTALPPTNVAAATAAVARVRKLAVEQDEWHARSRLFRVNLRNAGWNVPDGDSPIVPIRLDDATAALVGAERLRQEGIVVAAVRPPTVPAGTSRLRVSLKRTFRSADADRVLAALDAWRNSR